MIAYHLAPIDWWDGTAPFDPAVEAKIAELPASPRIFPPEGDPRERAVELTALHKQAVEMFRQLSWEGDGGWRYGAIPGEVNTQLWVAVKQENNGSTFVMTPVEMPWLDAFDSHRD